MHQSRLPDAVAKGTIAVAILAAALLLFQVPVFGQQASGSLSAIVTDATGAVIPGAKVVLTHEATQTTREATTNASGFFRFAAMQPGTYTITVTSPGLQTWEQKGIVLTQGGTISLPNITLQVATTRQEVVVEAVGEAVVPVDSGQISNTLSKNMVEELSIVGRDAAELIKIMPGMAMATGLSQNMWNSYTTATNSGPIGAFSANGTQPNGAMTMTSDGANLLDPGNQGTQVANINQNQVAEVSVLTSAYGAEFAKGPVTFQAIGKSGGAQFHGQGYLYARNGVFNSIDAYAKTSRNAKPLDDSYYYPGGDLGGPVLIPGTSFNKNRDKLFFYTAYEYMKQSPAGSLQRWFVPTDQMKAGNFSPEYLASLGNNVRNQRSQAVSNIGGNAGTFPDGQIPASQIDPNSKIYLGLMPKPNLDPVTDPTGANYSTFLGPPQNRWEYRIRGDYNISENTKLFVSWNHQSETTHNPVSIWWSIGGSLPYPTSQDAKQTSNVTNVNLVHVFSPTLTNEFVFARARFLNPIHMADKSAVDPATLGLHYTGLFENKGTPQMPNTFGWGNAAVGFATYGYVNDWAAGGKDAFGKLSDTPNISDNISWVKGTHTIKGGFYWDYARNNQTGGGLDVSSQGTFEYENWGATSSSNPLADMVMGRATQFLQTAQAPTMDFKYYQWGFFVQDNWKATRRLSLMLGMRFDHLGNWFPASGLGLAVWNQDAYQATNPRAWTGLLWHAIDSSIPESGFPSRFLFPLPRFGAAYDLFGNGKTVLRGGIGLYRYQLAYNSVSGGAYNAPVNIPSMVTTWGCCIGWNDAPNYTPSLGIPGLGSALSGILTQGDDRTPYTWTYNFTISQRVPWRSTLELSYQGNRSRDMMLRGPLSEINGIQPGAFFKANPQTGVVQHPWETGFDANDYRPLQNYTNIQLVGHGSYANYNAFQMTWQKQTGNSTFTMNYTFGKVLGIRDNQTDNGAGNGNTLMGFNMDANYGVLAYDHTHIFNAAYVINLPNPVHDNKFLGGITNGWTLSGITQLQSGAPIQPNTGGTLNVTWPGASGTSGQPDYVPGFSNSNYLGTSDVTLVPKLTCDPRKGLSDGQYFNPACFAPPTSAWAGPPTGPGANGDIIWPYIKGPKFFNSDLAIYKNFRVNESQKIQFRFSTFNFLNHPNADFSAGGNGDINLNFNNNNHLAQTNQNSNTTGKVMFATGRRVVEFTVKYIF